MQCLIKFLPTRFEELDNPLGYLSVLDFKSNAGVLIAPAASMYISARSLIFLLLFKHSTPTILFPFA